MSSEPSASGAKAIVLHAYFLAGGAARAFLTQQGKLVLALILVGIPLALGAVLLTATPVAAEPDGVSFAQRENFATGSQPLFVAAGDLNGDGRPDLAVANLSSDTVSVLLNTTAPGAGRPSFAARVDFPTGASPWSVAIGDLNGDGKPDLAVANSLSDSVSVLLNSTAPGASSPSFAARADFATGDFPVSVAIGDLNGDGRPDLAVTNILSDSVSVLLNTTAAGASSPSFAARADFATSARPYYMAIGDLNGDGRTDLAVTNDGSDSVSVLLNTTAPGASSPSFADRADFATSARPSSVAIGDLNGDG